MKNYILLDRDKIQENLNNIEKEHPYSLEIVHLSRLLKHEGEDLKSLLQQAFEAAREETPWSDANTGDISYEFPNFEDWYNKQQEQ